MLVDLKFKQVIITNSLTVGLPALAFTYLTFSIYSLEFWFFPLHFAIIEALLF